MIKIEEFTVGCDPIYTEDPLATIRQYKVPDEGYFEVKGTAPIEVLNKLYALLAAIYDEEEDNER